MLKVTSQSKHLLVAVLRVAPGPLAIGVVFFLNRAERNCRIWIVNIRRWFKVSQKTLPFGFSPRKPVFINLLSHIFSAYTTKMRFHDRIRQQLRPKSLGFLKLVHKHFKLAQSYFVFVGRVLIQRLHPFLIKVVGLIIHCDFNQLLVRFLGANVGRRPTPQRDMYTLLLGNLMHNRNWNFELDLSSVITKHGCHQCLLQMRLGFFKLVHASRNGGQRSCHDDVCFILDVGA
mmetsp:Transcript_6931/g.12486  ORF Transcript_6931/g.12486 Transcript_6931/m.12486 type:complete len:231 (-) Transcript_6931:215-907(-)